MSALVFPYLPTHSARSFLSRRRVERPSSRRVSKAAAFPRLRRLGLLGTVVVLASAREARGHAGTRRAERTTETLGAMPSPGVRETHLPLVTGIDYEPVPEGAIRLPAPDVLGRHHAPFEHVVSSRRSREFSDEVAARVSADWDWSGTGQTPYNVRMPPHEPSCIAP